MDRLAERLALDVPQCLVDARDRAHVDGAAAIEAAAIHDVPVVLDQERVLADQVVLELVDSRLDGQGPALDDGLAPADDALVGLDLQEQPARRHDIGGELGDLHGRFLFIGSDGPGRFCLSCDVSILDRAGSFSGWRGKIENAAHTVAAGRSVAHR
jgi:hypothetical protein